MIPIDSAKKFIKDEVFPLGNEKISIANAVGRILAEEIVADQDMPPFDRSQMDGYAIRSVDTVKNPASLKIVGESVAGRGWDGSISEGEAVRIMTGARVPVGADSVQKKELTREEGEHIVILKPASIGQNIVRLGAETAKDSVIFYSGEQITQKMIATLAAFGYASIQVYKKPRVSILSTGSEIVEITQKPAADQIRNSNSQMLAAFSSPIADVKILPIATDDLESLKLVIADAVSECDCLIISGGVSVGDYDFTKPALHALGSNVFFERVSLKPGKPTVFAKLDKTLIFGLPGNPVSIAVTYFVFVRYALLLLQAAKNANLQSGFARLSHPIKAAHGRDSLLPVSLRVGKKGRLSVETLRFSGSSNFIAFSRSEALVFVPSDASLEKGSFAEVHFLPDDTN